MKKKLWSSKKPLVNFALSIACLALAVYNSNLYQHSLPTKYFAALSVLWYFVSTICFIVGAIYVIAEKQINKTLLELNFTREVSVIWIATENDLQCLKIDGKYLPTDELNTIKVSLLHPVNITMVSIEGNDYIILCDMFGSSNNGWIRAYKHLV